METREQIYTRWLADGETWIGVFQNQAFDSARFGDKIALSFDTKNFDAAEIGKTKAPDHPNIGPGWKWLLINKVQTVEDALLEMPEPDDE